MEVIDTATAEAVRRDAAEGRKIEAAVDDAVDTGKITPARRKHWVELIAADPGTAEVLAAVPNETAVPMSEVGHSADNSDLAEPAPWFYA
jgi:hypothetical protein